jgi:hypothetical protein
VFSEGCRSANPTVYWHASRRLLPRRKPHRAVAAVVAMTPLVDVVVHLPMAVDARPYVGELWELDAGVPEQCHHRQRAQKLKLRMEKPRKIRSKNLSWTSLCDPHLFCLT